jgi:DNA-binding CsgD family transcriptional regulator/tetratricopeptide (TPR) repeat protein
VTSPIVSGLLERDAELSVATALVEAAREGRSGLLWIDGPPGIGKSSLLAAVRDAAVAAGMRVLSARGAELERSFPYGVARQLFEPVLARAGEEERKELSAGAAGVAAELLANVAGVPSQGGDFGVLHGFYWLLANLAGRSPLLVTVDDLHWSDSASLRCLAFLGRRIEELPVLVAASLRMDDPGADVALLTELVHDPSAVVLSPAPLTEGGSAAFLSRRLGSDVDPVFAAACHRASGGNPLLLRGLAGAIEGEGLEPVAANSGRVIELGPRAIARAVSLWLARAGPESGRLAVAAAILGDHAELRLAAALIGLTTEDAGRAAVSLAAVGLVQRDTLTFVHPLVRAAVEAETPVAERGALHLRAAELLAEAGAPAEQVSSHLMVLPAIGEQWAADVLLRAAQRSAELGANTTAAAQWRRALEEPAGDELRGELLGGLGAAELELAHSDAPGHLAAALELTIGAERRAELAERLGRALYSASRVGEAAAVLEAAMAELDPESDLRDHLEATLIIELCDDRSTSAEGQRRVEQVRARRLGDQPGGRRLQLTVAYYDAAAARPMAGAVAIARRAAIAYRHGQEHRGAYWSVGAILTAADQEEAVAAWDGALADAHRRGSLLGIAETLTFRSGARLHRGELSEAEADAREALATLAIHGGSALPVDQPHAIGYLALILRAQGRLEEAREVAESGFAMPQADEATVLVTTRAEFMVDDGRAEEACVVLRRLGESHTAAGRTNPAMWGWRSVVVPALVKAGEAEEARAVAEQQLADAIRFGAPFAIGRALRTMALIEPARPSIDLLRDSVDALHRSTARPEQALSQIELGTALQRQGHTEEARRLLREGFELASLCGAMPLADRAQAELVSGGSRPVKPSLGGPESLTTSERRVAELAAQGMTNREIAQTLYVTAKTVEVHLTNTYRKLGIPSRFGLRNALAPASTPVS